MLRLTSPRELVTTSDSRMLASDDNLLPYNQASVIDTLEATKTEWLVEQLQKVHQEGIPEPPAIRANITDQPADAVRACA